MSDWPSHDDMFEQIRVSGMVLTTWESHFLDSLEAQAIAGRQLSAKQAEILIRIWRRAFADLVRI